jgi:hypothetical protein
MAHEYVNTSVPKHLKGQDGYGPVVMTRNLPNGLEPILEDLSFYEINPDRLVGADATIDWCHRIVSCMGRTYTVLSRIGPCGYDNTKRLIRIAHHVAIDATERAEPGPAWVLRNFRGWISEVPTIEHRATGPTLPKGSAGSSEAVHWKAAGLDPGWAGVTARYLIDSAGSACRLVLPAGSAAVDVLGLVEDVIALIPPERRWNVTFSTRGTPANSNVRCQLLCLRERAPNLAAILRQPGRTIEVKPGASSAPSGRDSEAAREGRMLPMGGVPKASETKSEAVPPKPTVPPAGSGVSTGGDPPIGMAEDDEDRSPPPSSPRPVPHATVQTFQSETYELSPPVSSPTLGPRDSAIGRGSPPPSPPWPFLDIALYAIGCALILLAIMVAVIRGT